MKFNALFLSFSFLLLASIGYGQTDPVDSAQTSSDTMPMAGVDSVPATTVDSSRLLKMQERTGKLSGQLGRNREKLARLEKEFQDRTADKEKAIQQAEASAEANRTAAIELSNDASNRSKARRAEKSASKARRDTKSLQRADKNLQQLEKNISKVKKQIEDEEKQLNELQQQTSTQQ